MQQKAVERIKIENVVLELSLDGKSAAMIFEAEGKQYALKVYDSVNDAHRPLDVIELTS